MRPGAFAAGVRPEPDTLDMVVDAVLAAPHGGKKSSLQSGDHVAGRFRIVRLLGRGGMGEVYEAEDLELREQVAIKTVRPDVAEDGATLARFQREIALSRKVTHPNVCRVYDMFRHSQMDGGSLLLVSMEFLQGTTLSEHLACFGPFTIQEALPLVRDITEALGAAHAAGVIHRDLKPNNIMLVKESGKGGLRAVVTDFGLAIGVDRALDKFSLAATAEGFFVGTPAYMSPEQVEGKTATIRSDLYSLGLVLYEMVTGQAAFSGLNAFSIAAKRLTDPAPNPLQLVRDLPPGWVHAIGRCLERDPVARWESAGDVFLLLEGADRDTTGSTTVRSNRKWWTALVGGLAILATLGLGGALLQRLYFRGARVAGGRQSAAVLSLQDQKGDAPWLSPVLAEMLSSELAAGEKIRMVPSSQVQRAQKDLGLNRPAEIQRGECRKLQEILSADYLIIGKYTAEGIGVDRKLHLELRLADARTGGDLQILSEDGDETGLFDLVVRAGSKLREQLSLSSLSAEQAEAVRARLPMDPEAARCFGRGLEKLQNSDPEGARLELSRAVDLEPGHALSHSHLSAAWNAIGNEVRARDEAERAFRLADKLGLEDRSLVEARHLELQGQWDKAVNLYSQLASAHPDDLEHGLRLAATQTSGGKPTEALVTLAALRRLPSGADPRVDYREALANSALGEFGRQRESAARAAEKAARIGARWLAATSRLREADALQKLGNVAQAEKAYELALKGFLDLDDKSGSAQTEADYAWLLVEKGELSRADQMLSRSLLTFQNLGHRFGMATALNGLANLAQLQGDLQSSCKRFEDALALLREIDRKIDVATVLNNLGTIRHSAGRLVDALPLLRESLTLAQSVHAKDKVVLSLCSLGCLQRDLGRFREARQSLEEAIRLARESRDQDKLAFALGQLAGIDAMEGSESQGASHLEEALSVQAALDGKDAPSLNLRRAEFLERAGHLKEAGTAFGGALAKAIAARDRETEKAARLGLVKVAIDEGALDGLGAFKVFAADLAKSQIQEERIYGRILLALAEWRWNVQGSEAQLSILQEEVRHTGDFLTEMELRILLARLKSATAPGKAPRALFEGIRKDAEARGLRIISKKVDGLFRG